MSLHGELILKDPLYQFFYIVSVCVLRNLCFLQAHENILLWCLLEVLLFLTFAFRPNTQPELIYVSGAR